MISDRSHHSNVSIDELLIVIDDRRQPKETATKSWTPLSSLRFLVESKLSRRISAKMKFCSVALIASTATAFAFAPSKSPRTNHHQRIIIRTQQSPRLRLLPDPDLANLVTDSAFSSSSITTSNFIDGLLSDVGGFLLIASVGAGVYSNTLQEKQKEFQDKLEAKYMKKTDDAVITEPVKAVSL